jgi:hypothetical protein
MLPPDSDGFGHDIREPPTIRRPALKLSSAERPDTRNSIGPKLIDGDPQQGGLVATEMRTTADQEKGPAAFRGASAVNLGFVAERAVFRSKAIRDAGIGSTLPGKTHQRAYGALGLK